jgi:hypothetical protein
MNVANGTKLVPYKDLVNDMKEFIINKYDGKSINVYKGRLEAKVKSDGKGHGYAFFDPLFIEFCY